MRLATRYRPWLDLVLFVAAILVGMLAWVVVSDVLGWVPQEPVPAEDRGTGRDWYGMLGLFFGVVPALLVLKFVVYPLLGWDQWLFHKRARDSDENAA
jgi:hypothetical protein